MYSHYPDDLALLGACSGLWAESHPPPDLTEVTSAADPEDAIRDTLTAIYGWFGENETMIGNSVRDASLIPALAQLHEQTSLVYQRAARDLLVKRLHPGGRREDVVALVNLALEFGTWRSLAGGGLGAEAAAGLMTRAIFSAGS